MRRVVPDRSGEFLELREDVRSAPLRPLGVHSPDVVEVEVDREPRHVEVKQVERRAAAQGELVAKTLVDEAEELDETEDSLERPGAEAALASNAGEVAAVGEAVHAASRGAGRRFAGTITFQRRASFPPRVPGSR